MTELIHMADCIQAAPREALDRWRKAESYATAVMFDTAYSEKERIEARQEAQRTKIVYIATLAALQSVCVAAGFDSYQTRVWTLYYGGEETDLTRIAQRMKTNVRRIHYLLFSHRMSGRFCFALDQLSEYAEIQD